MVEDSRISSPPHTSGSASCSSNRAWTIVIVTVSLILSVYNIYACLVQLDLLAGKRKGRYESGGLFFYSKEGKYDPSKLFKFFTHEQYEIVMEGLHRNHPKLATVFVWILLIVEDIHALLSSLCMYAALKGGPGRRIGLWVDFNFLCIVASVVGSLVATVYVKTKIGDAEAFLKLLWSLGIYFYWLLLISVVAMYSNEVGKSEGEARSEIVEQQAHVERSELTQRTRVPVSHRNYHAIP